jgi:hypothetical protein
MTLIGLRLILLMFALVGFAGAGVALAVARQRTLQQAERDIGMISVAAMLSGFGALCTAVATGLVGVLAFGGVAVWASYVLMAQHLGLFEVDSGAYLAEEAPTGARHRH